MNSEKKINFSRNNNFNLIRLLAALQVVVFHSVEHLDIKSEWILSIIFFLKYFPGVPIFFFISGFLIYWSFDRNADNIKQFFKNRFLRIYPGLWMCLFVTIFLILFFSKDIFAIISDTKFYFWLVAQFSLFQFYTPNILRFWGVGTPNGSLWTIVVELQFYFIIPIIFYLRKRNKIYTTLLIITSIITNIIINTLDRELMITKLLGIFLLPYLYYFMFGILMYIYWNKIKKYIENKFVLWFLIYMTWNYVFDVFLGIETYSYWVDSPVNLISDFILLLLIFSFSATNVNLSNKLIGENDISYGIYIYHMLIINSLISLGCKEKPIYLLITLLLVIVISYLSWIFIEKPSLSLKNKKIFFLKKI